MRVRWVIWIAGGILALAIGLLFIWTPQPGRVAVQVLGVTNTPNPSYMVLVTNGTHRPHAFTAWTEFTEDGRKWLKINQGANSFSIAPNSSATITLPKSVYERRRITVACHPLSIKPWEKWRDSIRAMIGVKPSPAYKLYVEAR